MSIKEAREWANEQAQHCGKKIGIKSDWFRIYGKYMCSKKCADEFERLILKRK